jgi:hypothetical protein
MNRPGMRPLRRMHVCRGDMLSLDSSGRRGSKRQNLEPSLILLDVLAPAWQVHAYMRICMQQVTNPSTDYVLVAARIRRGIDSNHPSWTQQWDGDQHRSEKKLTACNRTQSLPRL